MFRYNWPYYRYDPIYDYPYNYYYPYPVFSRFPVPIQPPATIPPSVITPTHILPTHIPPTHILPTHMPGAGGPPIKKKYRFTMENFEIKRTRALHNDTVVISMAAAINGREASKNNKFMGDQNDGVHPVNLSVDVEVEPGQEVSFSYLVVNHHAGANAFEQLAQGAVKLAEAEVPAAITTAIGSVPGVGGTLGGLAGSAAHYIIGEIGTYFAEGRCDGVVAADKITFSSSDLERLTASGSYTPRPTYHKGLPSPSFCLDSQYLVKWNIRQL